VGDDAGRRRIHLLDVVDRCAEHGLRVANQLRQAEDVDEVAVCRRLDRRDEPGLVTDDDGGAWGSGERRPGGLVGRRRHVLVLLCGAAAGSTPAWWILSARPGALGAFRESSGRTSRTRRSSLMTAAERASLSTHPGEDRPDDRDELGSAFFVQLDRLADRADVLALRRAVGVELEDLLSVARRDPPRAV